MCWGFFWLAVGTIGLTRGTCTWKVVLNSIAVGAIPLCLAWLLFWMRGTSRGFGVAFVAGLTVMPLVLMFLGLRLGPDGRRSGTHMLMGIEHLMNELLGKHHACSGCGHDHNHESPQ